MSIADKLNYLITTKQLLKTEINKINNVLDDNSTFRSYPQELFNGYLDVLNNGTDTLWNNLEKVSQTGTEAILEGVETAPMKVELQGNTQQNGEPTPDTPIPVQVVKGENVVSVSGKNLQEMLFTDGSSNGIEWHIESDGSIIINGTTTSSVAIRYTRSNLMPVVEGKTYTLSATGMENIANFGYKNSGTGKDIAVVTTSSPSLTFEATSNMIAQANRLDLYIRADKTFVNQKVTLQLEEGSTATPYVPYSKTDYPISLGTLELCKIGNYQDYLYKNNGKWYVHKEIGKAVLDGSEGWTFFSVAQGNLFRNITKIINDINDSNYTPYSNYFKGIPFSQKDNRKNNNFYIGSIDDTLDFMDNRFDNVNDFKTWLSTHNTIVYYVLATPTEEEITDTTLISQLEAIYKAKSVKDKTYITQTNDDLPFILDVEAIKEYEVV